MRLDWRWSGVDGTEGDEVEFGGVFDQEACSFFQVFETSSTETSLQFHFHSSLRTSTFPRQFCLHFD
jgi:hypothetical protein